MENLNLIEILKLVAPGTELRQGLDNILKAKTGALIVISDSKEVLDIVDGGFKIEEEYTPARVYELAKMDGAIILSKDCKKILLANTQLNPKSNIQTDETGTRHRTAERTAKETGELVISISQRRNVITIFKGNFRYAIEDTTQVLSKANQAIQTLEKYKKVFDSKLSLLNEYEFNDIVTLDNVIEAMVRAEMVSRVVDEVKLGIYTLGKDGRLLEMQLEELVGNLEKEEILMITDYIMTSLNKKPAEALSALRNLDYEELMDKTIVAKILGYENFENFEEVGVYSKGYRILNKIPKMPGSVVENLVKTFKAFRYILEADITKLDDVEGIGEVRAKNIKQSLSRMQEQFLFENAII